MYRGRLDPHRGGCLKLVNGLPELAVPARFRASFPVSQIDGLKLPEAQRRRRAIEGCRNEAPSVASRRSLIAHPGGFDGIDRPEHDHDVCRFERLLDGLGKLCAPANVEVPPEGMSGRFEGS